MYMVWLFDKILAASLQTLAEKMSNTIYRAAKVCSYQSAYADKLLIYHGKDTFIYLLFCLSNVWDEFLFKYFLKRLKKKWDLLIL